MVTPVGSAEFYAENGERIHHLMDAAASMSADFAHYEITRDGPHSHHLELLALADDSIDQAAGAGLEGGPNVVQPVHLLEAELGIQSLEKFLAELYAIQPSETALTYRVRRYEPAPDQGTIEIHYGRLDSPDTGTFQADHLGVHFKNAKELSIVSFNRSGAELAAKLDERSAATYLAVQFAAKMRQGEPVNMYASFANMAMDALAGEPHSLDHLEESLHLSYEDMMLPSIVRQIIRRGSPYREDYEASQDKLPTPNDMDAVGRVILKASNAA